MRSISLLLALFLGLLATAALGKRYSVPGDALFPTETQITAFASTLVGSVISDTSASYAVPLTFNKRTGPPHPKILTKPANTDDIAKIFAFADAHQLRIAVSSTGHHPDVRNIADAAIHVDMTSFNSKSVDTNAMTVTVGPGQWWGDINKYLSEQTGQSFVVTNPDEPSVGPAGWVLGGGHGRLSRLFGYGSDNLLSLEVVLTNGTLVVASPSSNSDLFWALNGGGHSSFGIVTSLTFRIHPDPGPVAKFNGKFAATTSNAASIQNFLLNAPNGLTSYMTATPDTSSAGASFTIESVCFGDTTDCDAAMAPLLSIPSCVIVTSTDCVIQHPYANVSSYLVVRSKTPVTGSSFALYQIFSGLDLQTPGQVDAIFGIVRGYKASGMPASSFRCSFDVAYGGAAATMDPSGTETSINPAMRKSIAGVVCNAAWVTTSLVGPTVVAQMDSWAESILHPLSVDGWVYWNQPNHNFPQNDWQTRYWAPGTYDKLSMVKMTYDPNNILTCYHCVGWEDIVNVDPVVCDHYCSCSNMLTEGVCAHNYYTPSAYGVNSASNVLNADNGDFGGSSFPLRDEFETFIDTDMDGNVISYGFYVPVNSRTLAPSLGSTLGAALEFDTSSLMNPTQMPFEFVGITYNPTGHSVTGLQTPSFDFRMWFYPSEYARGIQCTGSGSTCTTTPFLTQKFNMSAVTSEIPSGYANLQTSWLAASGANLIPEPVPSNTDSNPVAIFGSFDGKVVFYDPLVSNTLLDSIPTTGELVFNWPATSYPKEGKYFTKVRLSLDGALNSQRYMVSFTDLVDAPVSSRGTPVFFGMQAVPNQSNIDSPVSSSKNCLISTDTVIDAGWIVTSGGIDYCCRTRGVMSNLICSKNSCGNVSPLIASDAYFTDGSSCFAKCMERS